MPTVTIAVILTLQITVQIYNTYSICSTVLTYTTEFLCGICNTYCNTYTKDFFSEVYGCDE